MLSAALPGAASHLPGGLMRYLLLLFLLCVQEAGSPWKFAHRQLRVTLPIALHPSWRWSSSRVSHRGAAGRGTANKVRCEPFPVLQTSSSLTPRSAAQSAYLLPETWGRSPARTAFAFGTVQELKFSFLHNTPGTFLAPPSQQTVGFKAERQPAEPFLSNLQEEGCCCA